VTPPYKLGSSHQDDKSLYLIDHPGSVRWLGTLVHQNPPSLRSSKENPTGSHNDNSVKRRSHGIISSYIDRLRGAISGSSMTSWIVSALISKGQSSFPSQWRQIQGTLGLHTFFTPAPQRRPFHKPHIIIIQYYFHTYTNLCFCLRLIQTPSLPVFCLIP
jgi:hypothetical protein